MSNLTNVKETHLRSVSKGISWRILATITTVSIVFLITGKIDTALEIGAIEVVAKIIIYYVHERFSESAFAWFSILISTPIILDEIFLDLSSKEREPPINPIPITVVIIWLVNLYMVIWKK